MGQLYEKMASDLKLRRYSARTQESYLWCARRFVRHFMRSPAEMGMKEIRKFLLVHHQRGASASSIKMYVAGLRFLYAVTLGRPPGADCVTASTRMRGEARPAFRMGGHLC